MATSDDLGDLRGRNALIVEDEYFLAVEMADAVRRVGGTVVGPVPDVEAALAIVDATKVDAAVLDVRLGDDTSFPVAKALREKGVTVVFVTGYDDWYMPDDLDDVPVLRKPADPDAVVRRLFEARQAEDV